MLVSMAVAPGLVVATFVLAGACGRVGFDPAAARGDGDAPAMPAAIYATTDRTLYAIDPVTLAPTKLFDLTRADSVVPQISDLALDSAGNLIALEEFAYVLYHVEFATGLLTPLPTTAQTPMFGAAFGPGDVLYGAGQDSNFYVIDPATGATTLVGAIGAQPAGDLVWTGSELVMSAESPMTSILMHIDLATGAGTVIGDTGRVNVYGLAMVSGQLIGLTSQGETDSIDLADGVGTVLDMGTLAWGGAASMP